MGLIPKWIASSFDFTIGCETFVVVGVKGKDDVGMAVTFTQQPRGARTLLGGSALFSIQAEPTQYITSYQWYCNSKTIPDATERLLLVENVTAKKAGVYKCAVSAGGAPVMSRVLSLPLLLRSRSRSSPLPSQSNPARRRRRET